MIKYFKKWKTNAEIERIKKNLNISFKLIHVATIDRFVQSILVLAQAYFEMVLSE